MMLNLAAQGYTREQIVSQLHAKAGNRLVKFRYDLLNRYDIKIGELTVKEGSRISFNSLAEIKRVAFFTIKEISDVDWLNDRIKPFYLLKMPDGKYAEWPLGVLMMSSPIRAVEYKSTIMDIEAYDTSLILKEDKFDNRYRIPAGTKYIKAITDILSSAGIWKINIINHPGTLGIDKEFEIGTPKLTVINQLLTEINYTSIWVDENGYFVAKPYVLPLYKDVEYTYKNDELSIIHNGAKEEVDLFNVPNKWIRVATNPEKVPIKSIYINDLPTSRTSTVNRGRIIVDYDEINDIYDQNTLNDYVRRLAYTGSQIYGKFIFETALMPHHSYMDTLYIEHSDLGVSNKYTETSWEMNLTYDGRMTHEARRVIRI